MFKIKYKLKNLIEISIKMNLQSTITKEIENDMEIEDLIKELDNDKIFVEENYENFSICKLYILSKQNNNEILTIMENKIKNIVSNIDVKNIYDKYPLSFWVYYDYNNQNANFHITTSKKKCSDDFIFWYTNMKINHGHKNYNTYDRNLFIKLIDSIIYNYEYSLIHNCKSMIDTDFFISINHNNGIITISKKCIFKTNRQCFTIKNIEEIVENLLIIIYTIEFNNIK